jgi:hypothetical protein
VVKKRPVTLETHVPVPDDFSNGNNHQARQNEKTARSDLLARVLKRVSVGLGKLKFSPHRR